MNRQSRAFSLIFPLLMCLAARLLFAGSSQIPAPNGGGSCNLGDPEIMAEIKKLISGMHVVTDHFSDCAHTPPDLTYVPAPQPASRVKLPDFCGYYKVLVKLEGTVPTYYNPSVVDLGRHCIGVSGGKVVTGPKLPGVESSIDEWDYDYCGQLPATGRAELIVGGGATITLHSIGATYIPDPLTWTRVTEVKVFPWRPCGEAINGSGTAANRCASFQANLGRDAHGMSAGVVEFEFDTPSALAFSRAGLSAGWDPSDTAIRLLFEDATDRLVEWTAANGHVALDDLEDDPLEPYVPRRLTMNSCVVDLVDISDGYEMRYYFPGQQPVSNSPLPALSGNPFRVWRVRNPSADPLDLNHIEVTEIVGGTTVSTVVFEYDGTTGDWTRVSGTSADEIHETVGARAENGDTVRFREYADALGSPVLRKENLCHEFDWGSEVVEERVGTVNPRVTAHTYYTDAENDGDNYGLLKLTVRPDGSWTRPSAS